MPSPNANTLGNGVVLVTSTVTGSYNSGAEQNLDVALGKPMNESMPTPSTFGRPTSTTRTAGSPCSSVCRTPPPQTSL